MGRGRPHHGNRRRGRSGGPREHRHTLTGTLVVSRPGAAHVETPEGDFELVRHGQREAMNGDEVEVAIIEQRGRAPRAAVRSVVTRAVETFLGRYATRASAMTSLSFPRTPARLGWASARETSSLLASRSTPRARARPS